MALSDNWKKIIDLVKELSAVELNAVVKALEEEFWVTATPMMVAWGWVAWWSDEDAWGWSDTVTVMLAEIWQQKIAVIKVVKEVLWLWLKEAKELVEKTPTPVKEKISSDEAEWIKAKLEEAGATVNLK